MADYEKYRYTGRPSDADVEPEGLSTARHSGRYADGAPAGYHGMSLSLMFRLSPEALSYRGN
jgi:hypothetical protein